jgi:hypothetical protein
MSILRFFSKKEVVRRQVLENDNEQLFNALQAEDNLATKIVWNRIYAYLKKNTQTQQTCQQGWSITFDDTDFEDMAVDTRIKLLEKMRKGEYTLTERANRKEGEDKYLDPVSYAIEIAKNKVMEYRTIKCRDRLDPIDGDKMTAIIGFSFEKEQVKYVQACLEQIGDPCKTLFKWRMEGYDWKEIFAKWQNNEVEKGVFNNLNTERTLRINGHGLVCKPSLRNLFFNNKF